MSMSAVKYSIPPRAVSRLNLWPRFRLICVRPPDCLANAMRLSCRKRASGPISAPPLTFVPARITTMLRPSLALTCGLIASVCSARADDRFVEDDDQIRISTGDLEAAVRKAGYVTGVAAQSLLDKKTGFRDAGFGL